MLIVRREELIAAGYEPDEVRQRLRSGELVRIRPGAYVGDALPRAPEERHRPAVRAAVPDLAAEAVISYVSAAVLRGVPTWGIALDRVHATRPRRSGARRGRVLHLHAAPLDPQEIARIDGIAVTSPARTVVDIARSVPFEQSVALADRRPLAAQRLPPRAHPALRDAHAGLRGQRRRTRAEATVPTT